MAAFSIHRVRLWLGAIGLRFHEKMCGVPNVQMSASTDVVTGPRAAHLLHCSGPFATVDTVFQCNVEVRTCDTGSSPLALG
jgi:hypothetical protein